MENAILIVVISLIIGGAVRYIYKAKKNGAKCIGCPDAGKGGCSGNCACCSGCGESESSQG